LKNFSTSKNGTKAETPRLTRKQTNQMIDQLVEIWDAWHQGDLNARYGMGDLLNEWLGPPTKRQPHGEGVLEKASERLKIAVSEFSRMRWFAYHFKSLAVLRRKYPDVKTWSEVKSLLPKLSGNGRKGKSSTNGKAMLVHGITRSLKAVSASFRKVLKKQLDEAEKELLQQSVQEMLGVVAKPLKLHVTVR